MGLPAPVLPDFSRSRTAQFFHSAELWHYAMDLQ